MEYRITFILLLLLLSGCITPPEARQENHCAECNRLELKIPSRLSPLSALSRLRDAHNKLESSATGKQRLHIYLEGDGRPWTWWNQPAADPNSYQLTALRLMQLDKNDSIYLNRPCYGTHLMAEDCHPHLWTAERYSDDIVSALNQGLNQIQKHFQATELVLIGHSGGGTLAMLLAQRRNDVVAVVTLAANLDHSAWTQHLNYFPLDGSLNAIDVDLPTNVLRWHFAAGLDQQVPAELVKSAAAQDPHAQFQLFEQFDHFCCWIQVWPSILLDLNEHLDQGQDKAPPRQQDNLRTTDPNDGVSAE